MKVLYALQKTGNGHIARAESIIPIIKKHAECDVLISGHNSQIMLNEPPTFDLKGISLQMAKKGGVSYFKTFVNNNYFQAIKDICTINLSSYDLIINDFEPISAWIAKLRNLPIVSLSHQAALLFEQTPKPDKKKPLEDLIIKYFAPSKYKFGFHFQSYNSHIFKPVIRNSIRNLKALNNDHYVVYLPSYPLDLIVKTLNKIPVKWILFHKEIKTKKILGNCEVFSINQDVFLEYFASCKGVLCNAGFELPAESLFLEKKLFCIPMKNQNEQFYNAKALELLGVNVSEQLDIEEISKWVESQNHIKVNYPDETENIIIKILEKKYMD